MIQCATGLKLQYVITYEKLHEYPFEKICLTLILLKIFAIYFCYCFVTNKKIAITHLWHAMEPQIMNHLIAKDKVAEQHI